MRYKAWNAHTFLAAIAASLWLRRSFLYKKTYIVVSSWHKHKITHIPSTSNFLPKDYLKISEVASRFLCTSYEFLEVYSSPRKILTWLRHFLIDFLYNWSMFTDDVSLPIWGKFPSRHDQSEALPRCGQCFWLVSTQHGSGIVLPVSEMSFCVKCQLFSQACLRRLFNEKIVCSFVALRALALFVCNKCIIIIPWSWWLM